MIVAPRLKNYILSFFFKFSCWHGMWLLLAPGVKQVSEEVERALAKIGPARISGR